MSGLWVGRLEECVSLYADDMFLYLQDTGPSLSMAFGLIQGFGDYSGFRINLFPIDDAVAVPSDCPIPLSKSFKYLRVVVQLPISRFLDLNLMPIIRTFRERVQKWQNLPLVVMG